MKTTKTASKTTKTTNATKATMKKPTYIQFGAYAGYKIGSRIVEKDWYNHEYEIEDDGNGYAVLKAVNAKPAKKPAKKPGWDLAPKGTRIKAGFWKGYKIGSNFRNQVGHVYELGMTTDGLVFYTATWKKGEDPRHGSLRNGRAGWPFGKLVDGKVVTVKRLAAGGLDR